VVTCIGWLRGYDGGLSCLALPTFTAGASRYFILRYRNRELKALAEWDRITDEQERQRLEQSKPPG
jgi:hypothetical protein